MKHTLLYLIAIVFAAVACENQSTEKPQSPEGYTQIELAQGGDELITASNQFGIDIFREILANEPADSNVFISPTSISIALSMAWNGAATNTKDSMATCLRFPALTDNQINDSNKSLIDGLTTIDEEVKLNIANSIWYRQGFEILPAFLNVNSESYYAEVAGLDFDSPEAVNTINGWVSDKTNGKIPKVIENIDPDMMLFIYFKGLWTKPFDTLSTHNLDFTLQNGNTIQTPMMNMTDSLAYSSNALFRAVDLDYGQGNYSMVVMLPNEGKNTDDIAAALTPENWQIWLNEFQTQRMELTMPRFSFRYGKTLNSILSIMGMGIAFNDEADFSRISNQFDLVIDYVLHKSFVDVNETGTEAAAVTVIGWGTTSMPDEIPYLTINRPFLFAIREKSTGAIVFIGRVANPGVN